MSAYRETDQRALAESRLETINKLRAENEKLRAKDPTRLWMVLYCILIVAALVVALMFFDSGGSWLMGTGFLMGISGGVLTIINVVKASRPLSESMDWPNEEGSLTPKRTAPSPKTAIPPIPPTFPINRGDKVERLERLLLEEMNRSQRKEAQLAHTMEQLAVALQHRVNDEGEETER